MKNILTPGQPGFRVVSAPEHRVSQQPPLSISPIVSSRLESQQYRGLVPAAILIGGVPVFLYLFARVSFFESLYPFLKERQKEADT